MDNHERPAHPTNARMHSEMTGITKREYFAAMAMQGIIAGIYGGGGDNYQRQLNEWKIDNGPLTLVGTALAKDALGYADELLKALES